MFEGIDFEKHDVRNKNLRLKYFEDYGVKHNLGKVEFVGDYERNHALRVDYIQLLDYVSDANNTEG